MDEKRKINIKELKEDISEKTKAGLETVKDNAEKVSEFRRQVMEKQREAKLRRNLEALNPIFPRDLSNGSFLPSKMIRIVEMDKKHASSKLCEGSIGHESLVKDLRIVTIYPNQADIWALQFYPDANQEFYYVDPVNQQQYIAIDSYFDYLRQARIG